MPSTPEQLLLALDGRKPAHQERPDVRPMPDFDRCWLTDTNWRDDGRLPSGDTFVLLIRCEHGEPSQRVNSQLRGGDIR